MGACGIERLDGKWLVLKFSRSLCLGETQGECHVMGVKGWASVNLAFTGVSLLPGVVVYCPLHVTPREPLDLQHRRLHISIRFACVYLGEAPKA